MITMDEIRNHVENNGYTLHNRGEIVTTLPDGKNYITGNIFVSEGINYVLSDDKFPYGKPQTDEVARGSGTESMAVRD